MSSKIVWPLVHVETHVLVSDHSFSVCGWPSRLVNERARHICKVALGGLGWLVKRAVSILAPPLS